MYALPRPILNERPDYEPAAPSEQFIVPLLRQHIERAITTYAPPASQRARVLDVGCGRQPFRRALEALGYRYTGLDVQQSPEGNVDVVCAIDATLPAELAARGPFNLILCTEVLEHVADWDAAFRNMAATMSPGAYLIVTCPHFYQLHEEPYDFWRPTLHSLRYFAERVGLISLNLEAAGDGWDVLGTLLANCRPSAASGRLLHRGIAKVVRLIRRWLFYLLESGYLQKVVRLNGPLYLSNVAIFQKSL